LNRKLEDFKKFISNKRAAVLGIGISNTPLIQYLYDLGVSITAFDKAEQEKLGPVLENFKGMDIQYSLGEDYLSRLTGFDIVFRTPGMRVDLPELLKAKEEGTVITSEMEIFLELCPAKIFAVTGSDGKTTTTSLIYHILKEEGYNCWLGGNIGMPLLSRIGEVRETDMVVLELSSFQLHTIRKSPEVAVITNLSPNHLDVHKSMEEYVDAKKNIFRYQQAFGKVILNYDNTLTRNLSDEVPGQFEYFSRVNTLDRGAIVRDSRIVYHGDDKEIDIMGTGDILIPGVHNIENFLAATAAVIDYVKPESIYKVATSFNGVEHRIEFVRELKGVKYYNSAIDSSPSRTTAAMNTFPQKVILIAGGKDKGIPYDEIGEPIVNNVKHLYLIGATADKIEQAVKAAVERTGKGAELPITRCTTYDEVVRRASEIALEGDIVLLSPASTSFDMFRNFEERGNVFKDLVNKL
jgi:UDP-N-acetylmuramoylalanine--D-glutamate ligase